MTYDKRTLASLGCRRLKFLVRDNMIHVYEHAGILLFVEYIKDRDITTFTNVRVVDILYRPIGPNLIPLLKEVIVLDGEAVPGAMQEGEAILSAIAEEIA